MSCHVTHSPRAGGGVKAPREEKSTVSTSVDCGKQACMDGDDLPSSKPLSPRRHSLAVSTPLLSSNSKPAGRCFSSSAEERRREVREKSVLHAGLGLGLGSLPQPKA
jgi:hypothetical protein